MTRERAPRPYLFKLRLQHSVAQCGLPLQLPPTVLAQVEQLKHLLEFYHLPKYIEMKCVPGRFLTQSIQDKFAESAEYINE